MRLTTLARLGRARYGRCTPFAKGRHAVALLIALVSSVVATGCGTGGDANKVVVYSGREAELVDPLYKQFEQQTGIDVEVRYAGTPELAATIREEGSNARADVFYAQDAGSMISVEDRLAPLPGRLLDRVPTKYRDRERKWTGITGRVRVLTYNTERVRRDELPESVFDLTSPKWRGRVGIAPGNASFQAFVTAMRIERGDDAARAWLKAMKDNDVQTFESNSAIVEAVARGELDAGLANHYYLYQTKAETPDAPIANHNFADGDPGSLVNVSAAGILVGAPHKANAEKLIEFMLTRGQEYFATEAEEKEYPLVSGYANKLPKDLTPLDEVEGPDVTLDQLGAGLDETVKMIGAVGFTGT